MGDRSGPRGSDEVSTSPGGAVGSQNERLATRNFQGGAAVARQPEWFPAPGRNSNFFTLRYPSGLASYVGRVPAAPHSGGAFETLPPRDLRRQAIQGSDECDAAALASRHGSMTLTPGPSSAAFARTRDRAASLTTQQAGGGNSNASRNASPGSATWKCGRRASFATSLSLFGAFSTWIFA